jgi:dihydrofolate synthase/folylpolyglutamate synthase
VAHSRYHQAVDYLQRRLWHELPILPVERVLQQRVRQVLAHLGDPHLSCPVIHVAGSAGKGSTSAIAASILRAAGHRTGLYTSPHLQTFIERYDVDGRLIPPEKFADLILGLDPLVRQMHIDVLDGRSHGRPSLVEVAFAAGMRHFANEGCDAAVVEVGLGGRTDCTNVFDIKPVTVITNIELEHTERLGRTRAEIAAEKAAIIRRREIVVTGERHLDALDVIERRCVETGATPWRLGEEVRVRIVERHPTGTIFNLRIAPLGLALDCLSLPLLGDHQVSNAALAAAAAVAYDESIDARAIGRGLASVRVNGRLEQVQDAPRVVLDGAHNPAEARSLRLAIERHALDRGARLHLVCGILADKDQAAMVRQFAPIAHSAVVTQPPLVERQGDPARMVDLLRAYLPARSVALESDPMRALDTALARARPRDVVLVTGSMFLVGAVRERWMPEDRILRRLTAAL